MHHYHDYETTRIEEELRIIAAKRIGDVRAETRGGRRFRRRR
jgi:hypothetical protein